jgi:crossover junction endodeoxyribonuclease RuvC
MTILGIDPGSRRIGYGVVDAGNPPTLHAVGIVPITEKANPAALAELKHEIERLIAVYRPTHLGVEKLFFMKNRTTGIAVAEARGVVLSAAYEAGLHIHEYTPNEIKLALTGDGGADKRAIAKMVRLILKNAPEDKLPAKLIDDATDALAIALVAAQRIPLAERLGR